MHMQLCNSRHCESLFTLFAIDYALASLHFFGHSLQELTKLCLEIWCIAKENIGKKWQQQSIILNVKMIAVMT